MCVLWSLERGCNCWGQNTEYCISQIMINQLPWHFKTMTTTNGLLRKVVQDRFRVERAKGVGLCHNFTFWLRALQSDQRSLKDDEKGGKSLSHGYCFKTEASQVKPDLRTLRKLGYVVNYIANTLYKHKPECVIDINWHVRGLFFSHSFCDPPGGAELRKPPGLEGNNRKIPKHWILSLGALLLFSFWLFISSSFLPPILLLSCHISLNWPN